ncbi:MAG: ABC transporter permease [Verrucomicrobiae bacterium]|nr:ABC transporter permease [Verrucomicrobiae bacterium]
MRFWFPIERRELLVSSRRWMTYARRLFTPAAVMAFTFLILGKDLSRLDQREMGQFLFLTTAWIAFFYASFSGFALTADCLSREKREHTLGLLFLTHLRSFDIVLGKLISHSIVALSGLVATLPLLMIPVLLGGISLSQVGQTATILLLTMLLSLAAGLFASSLLRTASLATATAVALLLLYNFSGFVLLSIASAVETPAGENLLTSIACGLLTLSPVAAMLKVSTGFSMQGAGLAPPYSSPIAAWEILVMVQSGAIAVLILAAVFFTARFWQEKPERQFFLWQRLRHWLLFGPAWYRRRVYQRWFAQDPIAWMLVRPWYKPIVVWLILGLFAAFFALSLELQGKEVRGNWLWLAWMTLGLFKVALSLESSQGLAREIRQQELEALLGTPLRASDFIASHWRALRILFLKPLVALVVLVLVMFYFNGAIGTWPFHPFSEGERLTIWLQYGGLLLLFFLDCWALGWVGLWQGLKLRKQLNSGLYTMVLVLGMPWILTSVAFGFLVWVNGHYHQPLPEQSTSHLLLLVFAVPISLMLGLRGRQQVKKHFRALALQHRYECAPPPWWQRLGGWWQRVARPAA